MNDQPLDTPTTAGGAPQPASDPSQNGSSRRDAIRTLGKFGLGAAALSFAAFGPKVREALAQSAPEPVDILNFALTLEYLEMYYYQEGTDSIVSDSDVFALIRDHEEAHVDALTGVVESLGGEPVSPAREDFDFTAGGNFDPFNDYGQFLTLAQGFEDTGVRAYKGQVGSIPSGAAYFTPALQIHALEARHAAEVRRLRADEGASVQPWIILDSDTDGTALEAVYGAGEGDLFPAEENVMQAGVDLTTLGDGDYTPEQASAAFDEPLDMATVNTIAGMFMQMEPPAVTLDFSDDFGVLNYAYALEQLETAFYAQALANIDSYSSEVQDVLSALAAHEDIHRQTLQDALGDNAIGQLTPDFSGVDFSSEMVVLSTAQVLEDVGVSAYNGAGRLLENGDFVAAAGSIVSVEARHAAAIRDLMDPSDDYFGGTYAIDGEYVIGEGGLDEARNPDEIIEAASGFIANEIIIENPSF